MEHQRLNCIIIPKLCIDMLKKYYTVFSIANGEKGPVHISDSALWLIIP